MSLVNRLLDTFFRALDAVDLARDRLDRALGRSTRPEPWSPSPLGTTPAPPAVPAGSPGIDATEAPVASARAPRTEHPRSEPRPASSSRKRAQRSTAGKAPARSSKASGAAKKQRSAASKEARTSTSGAARASAGSPASARRKKQPAAKASRSAGRADGAITLPARPAGKAPGANRKGSVDRSGKDLDSPRAKAILETLRARRGSVVTEDATLDGKRVLARVLWALGAAEEAGSELGLTAADASALLHLAADMEVFSTNVARACRDEDTLVEETEPDGRSKRYRLTAAGRAAAAALPTRSLATT